MKAPTWPTIRSTQSEGVPPGCSSTRARRRSSPNILPPASRGLDDPVRVGEEDVSGPKLELAVAVLEALDQARGGLGVGQGQGDGLFAAGPDMEGRGMAGDRVPDRGGRKIDDTVKGGRKYGLAGLADDWHERPVDLAKDPAGVPDLDAALLDHAADQRGQQPGPHAVAHDVADEQAAAAVGNRDQVEEIPSEGRGRDVAVGEMQGARLGPSARRKTG